MLIFSLYREQKHEWDIFNIIREATVILKISHPCFCHILLSIDWNEIKWRANEEFRRGSCFLDVSLIKKNLLVFFRKISDCAQISQITKICNQKSEISLWTHKNWFDLFLFLHKWILGETSKTKWILTWDLHYIWATKEQLLSNKMLLRGVQCAKRKPRRRDWLKLNVTVALKCE